MLLIDSLALRELAKGTARVNTYTRKDGTVVQGHSRTHGDAKPKRRRRRTKGRNRATSAEPAPARRWTAEELASIPDDVLRAEYRRRSSASGGRKREELAARQRADSAKASPEGVARIREMWGRVTQAETHRELGWDALEKEVRAALSGVDAPTIREFMRHSHFVIGPRDLRRGKESLTRDIVGRARNLKGKTHQLDHI